jgi:hypothetical protein
MTKWKKTGGPSGNEAIEGDGFYISYMPPGGMPGTFAADGDLAETALVRGSKFYILNGDHRKAYEALVGLGFDACKEHFENHRSETSRWSNTDKEAAS